MPQHFNSNSGPTTRGVRIITESTYSTGISTRTIGQALYAGDRSRTETIEPAGRAFEIERRGRRQKFRVYPSRRQYQVISLFDLATEKEKGDFLHSGRHWRKAVASNTTAPTRELRITFTYRPTGRVQRMFGCTAREWIITRRDQHDERTFAENWSKESIEAWYFDSAELAFHFPGFSDEFVQNAFCYAKSGDEREVIEHSGERPTGLCALRETKTLRHLKFPRGEVREETSSSSMRVISITQEDLPLSLFEVPKGFCEMPVYPSRFTMARLNWGRTLNRIWQSS